MIPSKFEWDLTNGPLSKLLELLDTQFFFGVRSVGPVGDFLEWLDPFFRVSLIDMDPQVSLGWDRVPSYVRSSTGDTLDILERWNKNPKRYTLPETNSSHLKRCHFEGKIIFNPYFSGANC